MDLDAAAVMHLIRWKARGWKDFYIFPPFSLFPDPRQRGKAAKHAERQGKELRRERERRERERERGCR